MDTVALASELALTDGVAELLPSLVAALLTEIDGDGETLRLTEGVTTTERVGDFVTLAEGVALEERLGLFVAATLPDTETVTVAVALIERVTDVLAKTEAVTLAVTDWETLTVLVRVTEGVTLPVTVAFTDVLPDFEAVTLGEAATLGLTDGDTELLAVIVAATLTDEDSDGETETVAGRLRVDDRDGDTGDRVGDMDRVGDTDGGPKQKFDIWTGSSVVDPITVP